MPSAASFPVHHERAQQQQQAGECPQRSTGFSICAPHCNNGVAARHNKSLNSRAAAACLDTILLRDQAYPHGLISSNSAAHCTAVRVRMLRRLWPSQQQEGCAARGAQLAPCRQLACGLGVRIQRLSQQCGYRSSVAIAAAGGVRVEAT